MLYILVSLLLLLIVGALITLILGLVTDKQSSMKVKHETPKQKRAEKQLAKEYDELLHTLDRIAFERRENEPQLAQEIINEIYRFRQKKN